VTGTGKKAQISQQQQQQLMMMVVVVVVVVVDCYYSYCMSI
jgi:hypothetical protein